MHCSGKSDGHAALGLDLFRGAAAVMVFAFHLRVAAFVEFGFLDPAYQTLATKAMFAITRMGMEAVLAFFVLSGFLVGGQVLRQVRTRAFDVRVYALDRATRIVLPLIPAVLLTVAVGFFAFNETPQIGKALGNIIGLNGLLVETLKHNGCLWTIAYEIWFYVLAGAFGWLLAGNAVILPVLLLGCGLAVFTVLDVHYLVFWLMGAMTSVYVDTKQKWVLMGIGLVLVLTGCLCWQLGSASFSLKPVAYLPAGTAELLLAQGFCFVIPGLWDQRVSELLKKWSGFVGYLGGISYTLYLVHYPVFAMFDVMLPRVRVPTESGHRFRNNSATDSETIRPPSRSAVAASLVGFSSGPWPPLWPRSWSCQGDPLT